MTIPKAHVVHVLDHRARIMIPSKRRAGDYFTFVEAGLAECGEVRAVRTNPITGSVLVSFQSDIENIKNFARSRGLFELEALKPEKAFVEPLSRRLATRFERIDRRVRRKTHGSLDLPTFAFAGLMGAAAFQLCRGRWFPPALTLLENAIWVIRDVERTGHAQRR